MNNETKSLNEPNSLNEIIAGLMMFDKLGLIREVASHSDRIYGPDEKNLPETSDKGKLLKMLNWQVDGGFWFYYTRKNENNE